MRSSRGWLYHSPPHWSLRRPPLLLETSSCSDPQGFSTRPSLRLPRSSATSRPSSGRMDLPDQAPGSETGRSDLQPLLTTPLEGSSRRGEGDVLERPRPAQTAGPRSKLPREGSPKGTHGDGCGGDCDHVVLAHPIEASFQHFAESLSDLVWSARPDGDTDFYNRSFLDYLGTTLDRVERPGLGRGPPPRRREAQSPGLAGRLHDGRRVRDRVPDSPPRRSVPLAPGPRHADAGRPGPDHPLVRDLHRHRRGEAGGGRAGPGRGAAAAGPGGGPHGHLGLGPPHRRGRLVGQHGGDPRPARRRLRRHRRGLPAAGPPRRPGPGGGGDRPLDRGAVGLRGRVPHRPTRRLGRLDARARGRSSPTRAANRPGCSGSAWTSPGGS